MSKTTPRVATRLMLSLVVIITLSMGYFCSVDVFAHPSKKTSIQELSSQEKLEAEQRLWDWAIGPA